MNFRPRHRSSAILNAKYQLQGAINLLWGHKVWAPIEQVVAALYHILTQGPSITKGPMTG